MSLQIESPKFDHLLRSLSRSFYISLRVLPKSSRPVLSLAYLLARAADTIADTQTVPAEKRLLGLDVLQNCIEGKEDLDGLTVITSDLSDSCSLHDERELLYFLKELIPLLKTFDEADLIDVRDVLRQLISGMRKDLYRFSTGEITALNKMEDLDQYCHLAAGVVGPFWTRVICRHDLRLQNIDREKMSDCGEKYGRALQMINVIRDLNQDLQIGRCYIPDEILSVHHLQPRDLLDCANNEKVTPVMVQLIKKAVDLLGSGERYFHMLPRWDIFMRLAIIWPFWIGLETLQLILKKRNFLGSEVRHKISRFSTRWILLKSIFIVIFCPSRIPTHQSFYSLLDQ